ncbi:glycoside hydrolase family 31 protein [Lactiplantibacillus sp. WILCCON 0030]|uniref:Glycoside hydrolase family 31 protein n=1 Tax=Lactiplantibacillus brownii TaxID=3069269 RepID=A0ABU1A5A7_9LACO|nr:TIM-barrel domain-containing protein [Lactiplantibacillus brownii]MDQ7936175.1 glycoside hydrolase family 31 protein [Lactiplantibacillus brownii]
MSNIVQVGSLRLTILTTKLIRIEYSETAVFEDQFTQLVQNRDFAPCEFTVVKSSQQHELEIITTGFHLYYDGGHPAEGNLYIDAAHNYSTYDSRWFFGDRVAKNLKGTIRTLDKADGAVPLPDGLMSKDGISVLDDSKSFTLMGAQVVPRQTVETDLYYFAYGRDYQTTLKVYYQLTGLPPLIPRFALGNWWSRFYRYTQREYLDLMTKFDQRQVPISVAVLDMDWHPTKIPAKYGSGWTGYTWNQDYFPNPKALLQTLHAQGRKVTLNVHPAAGIRANEACYPAVARQLQLTAGQPALFNLQNAAFKQAYFELVHRPLEQAGVDFWWLDWQQGGARSQRKVDPLWLLNIDHYQDSAKQHAGTGLILSRYAGPGSHRYPIGFSGDTVASWASLQFQPYFTATATNIGYTWWSHDIGGHMHGAYDAELSLRWLQLGVFSPILRLHSSSNPFMSKEPWNYPTEIATMMIQFLQLRAQLLPYLDSANEDTHRAGVPLIQPMYYGHGDDAQAYQVPNEYQFGPAMIVAPITTPVVSQTQLASTPVWLPTGEWVDFFTGLRYHGNRYFQAYRERQNLPVFVRMGCIVPLNPDVMAPAGDLPTNLKLKIFVGAQGTYKLVEHQGAATATTTFIWHDAERQLEIVVIDPQQIIPADRQYDPQLVGATGTAVMTDNQTISFEDFAVRGKDDSVMIMPLIQQRLQFANLPFDLKRDIWRTLSSGISKDRCLAYIATLENASLQGMLMELFTCVY